MRQHNDGPDDDRALHRRGLRLVALAAGAGAAVVLVALGTPGPMQAGGERSWVDEPPPAAVAASHRLPALDAGVDWEHVERAGDMVPLSVAAYER
jgi:hypothetical protein